MSSPGSSSGKLTKKRARALLEGIGQRMAAHGESALDAAVQMWKGASVDLGRALQIRKLMYKSGVGRLFDTLCKAPNTQTTEAKEKVAAALRKLTTNYVPLPKLAQQFNQDAGSRAAQPFQPAQQPAAQGQPQQAPQPAPPAQPTAAQRKAEASIVAGMYVEMPSSECGPGSGKERGGDWLSDTANHDRTNLNGLAQEANKLRDALAARTMSRTERELEHGKPDLSRLAQIGSGLTLRPYQETTIGRSLDTAVYLMLDRSGSMGWAPSALEITSKAAWAIATACQHSRVKFLLGAYNAAPITLTRCASLAAVRSVIERLKADGCTLAPNAVTLAVRELARVQAKRKVLVMLCDGDFAPEDACWPAALKAGVDFRMTALVHAWDGRSTQQDAAKTRAELTATLARLQVWQHRCAIVGSGDAAAHAMVRELRVMLDKGSREALECA